MTQQTTIAQSFTLTGVGLHSGDTVTVTVQPASADEGRYFVRTDLPNLPKIPATVEAVSQTQMSTELAHGEAKVRTVEHLLSALVGQGIDNARIEVDGAELPLLDGSGQNWVEKMQAVGQRICQGGEKTEIEVTTPVWVQADEAIVAAFPATQTRLSYGIDFPVPAIGQQWYSWEPAQNDYDRAIAPARTFVMAQQVEALRQAGLIKGGSLDNALVCNEEGWLNPPLRFANEPVRHKLLDLVGDLSLLGTLPKAHIFAYKASHDLHIKLAHRLAQTKHR
jgi:UDP-3-O-[3-hydroxymyristoyl] N-acetylglucosamine deacetylase